HCSGSEASTRSSTVMWSAAVLDPALPGRSSAPAGSPVPPGPWSMNPNSGCNPNVFLNVFAAPCLAEYTVTSEASRSTVITASRAGAPPSCHATARASASACQIAASAAAPPSSATSAATVRDTVAGEATGPNTPGAARNTAMSTGRRPPTARLSAACSSTVPGSCTAVGRHRANPARNPAARPILAAVSTSSRPPACDTTPRAPTPSPILATRPLRFTPEVPFRSRDLCLWLDTASLAERHFPHIHPGAPPQDHETARTDVQDRGKSGLDPDSVVRN